MRWPLSQVKNQASDWIVRLRTCAFSEERKESQTVRPSRNCVFRANRPRIPIDVGHPFRSYRTPSERSDAGRVNMCTIVQPM